MSFFLLHSIILLFYKLKKECKSAVKLLFSFWKGNDLLVPRGEEWRQTCFVSRVNVSSRFSFHRWMDIQNRQCCQSWLWTPDTLMLLDRCLPSSLHANLSTCSSSSLHLSSAQTPPVEPSWASPAILRFSDKGTDQISLQSPSTWLILLVCKICTTKIVVEWLLVV